MKKEVLIILIIIILLFGLYFINDKIIKSGKGGYINEDEKFQCSNDDECIPSSCCHANSCFSIREKLNCSGIYCTQVCEHGTLDCGQGSCDCVNNKCKAVFREEQ